MPVGYEKEERRSWFLESDQKDPLSEDSLQFHPLDTTRLKLEPTDESYHVGYNSNILSTKLPVMYSIPSPNLLMVSCHKIQPILLLIFL